MPVSAPLPEGHPMLVAWETYKASDDYANSRRWAMRIAPMVSAGDPDHEVKRTEEIMPREQRERHVEGSLWAAFVAGYTAAIDGARTTVATNANPES